MIADEVLFVPVESAKVAAQPAAISLMIDFQSLVFLAQDIDEQQ